MKCIIELKQEIELFQIFSGVFLEETGGRILGDDALTCFFLPLEEGKP
jgi:hypothetical protein